VADAIEGEASEAAERYAQAAFELARDSNALEAMEKDFAAFSEALAGSDDLRAAVRSPLIAPEDKSRALVAVAKKLGLSELGANVIGLAAKNGRAADLPGIAKKFATLLARHRGQSQVEIISAVPMEQKQLDDLLASLSAALGRKVTAKTTIDPALIGGFVVQAGSRQFDASIKSKLDTLKLALKGA
jgi:F-type H+-transporting ATPase subunit delta